MIVDTLKEPIISLQPKLQTTPKRGVTSMLLWENTNNKEIMELTEEDKMAELYYSKTSNYIRIVVFKFRLYSSIISRIFTNCSRSLRLLFCICLKPLKLLLFLTCSHFRQSRVRPMLSLKLSVLHTEHWKIGGKIHRK